MVPFVGDMAPQALEEAAQHVGEHLGVGALAFGHECLQAVGDLLILRAVRESGGFAIAVDDDAIQAGLDEVAGKEGFLLCPEGAATYAAWQTSLKDGRIQPTDRSVLFNCATGLKYPLPKIEKSLDRHGQIDWAQFRR